MKFPFKIMVVDDEEAMRESLSAWLYKAGYTVILAAGGREALDILENQEVDLALIDIKMPGMDGLELLERIRAERQDVLTVMITGYGSIETAVNAMKLGANDYLLKPFDPENLLRLLLSLSEKKALKDENEALRARLAERESLGLADLVGQSEAMRRVFALIEEVAPTETPVLITGETGTGKELVARALHSLSPRAIGPFVAINCGAMSESILESELFGHERGAFTGAVKARRGRLELANRGTLFLDEIGDISPSMQVGLLRVLEERKYFRLGGQQEIESDFRLICATHRDLPKLIEDNRFRQDFFYRINVISINVPPLRERSSDIPLLAQYFLTGFAREMGKKIEGLSPEAIRMLTAHDWPGNVRELRNVMERAVVVTRQGLIDVEALTFLRPEARTIPGQATLSEVEGEYIRQTLDRFQWNISKTAKILGLDRGTLSRRMKKYGLDKPR